MSTISQNLLKRLPLKFKNESFGAIKIFKNFFSGGNLTGNEPKIDRK